MSGNDIRQQAQAILDDCDHTTPRHHIVWAAGTVVCDRAFYFAEFPILTGRLPGWGWPSHNGRMFHCGRDGVHICANTTYRPEIVPPVLWAEIAALATLDRIGVDLHRRILESVRESQSRVLQRRDCPGPQERPWHELMAESQTLARLVWQRCQPGVPRQLDLLELIGAGAS